MDNAFGVPQLAEDGVSQREGGETGEDLPARYSEVGEPTGGWLESDDIEEF